MQRSAVWRRLLDLLAVQRLHQPDAHGAAPVSVLHHQWHDKRHLPAAVSSGRRCNERHACLSSWCKHARHDARVLPDAGANAGAVAGSIAESDPVTHTETDAIADTFGDTGANASAAWQHCRADAAADAGTNHHHDSFANVCRDNDNNSFANASNDGGASNDVESECSDNEDDHHDHHTSGWKFVELNDHTTGRQFVKLDDDRTTGWLVKLNDDCSRWINDHC